MTGPDGKYALAFDNHQKGALVGVHSIRVREIPGHNEPPPKSTRAKNKYILKGPTTVEVKTGKNTYNVEVVTNNVGLVTR